MGAYSLSLLENIFLKGINRPLTVEMGDISWREQPAALLCVCNGRHYGGQSIKSKEVWGPAARASRL